MLALSFSLSLPLLAYSSSQSLLSLFLLSYFFFFAPVFLIVPRPACRDADFF